MKLEYPHGNAGKDTSFVFQHDKLRVLVSVSAEEPRMYLYQARHVHSQEIDLVSSSTEYFFDALTYYSHWSRYD